MSRSAVLTVSLCAAGIDGELPAAPAADPAGHRRSRRQEPRGSAAGQRPGGEEAGRARPHGPNAGDVQLHAGKRARRSWVFNWPEQYLLIVLEVKTAPAQTKTLAAFP